MKKDTVAVIALPTLPRRTLTEAVPCPACGAKAGQACRENGAPTLRSVGTVRAHLGRTQ